VVISANNAAASGDFYTRLFGWQLQKMSAELTGVMTPAGPTAALRSGVPEGFPGMVPYIQVPDVAAMLERVVAAGASGEKAAWSIPGVGTLARFTDPSGTIYG
jgi:predicted enzyme related to lactoylglutathione lyase